MAVTLEASTPPRADRAVVFAADGQYAALRHAGGGADRAAARRAGFRHLPLRSHGRSAAGAAGARASRGALLPGGRRGTSSTALGLDPAADAGRLPAAGAAGGLRGGVPALLYLDADVFVQGGDFAALLGVDLGSHPSAAVRDNIAVADAGATADAVYRRLGVSGAPYFNAGVMLIDVAGFNGAGGPGALPAASGGRTAERDDPADQNLLNATLHGDWAELSPMWNWQYTWASRLFEAMEDANVVHFIGPRKPWTHDRGRAAAAVPAGLPGVHGRAFPGAAGRAGRDVAAWRTGRFWRMLVKHLLSLGKTWPPISTRFPTI